MSAQMAWLSEPAVNCNENLGIHIEKVSKACLVYAQIGIGLRLSGAKIHERSRKIKKQVAHCFTNSFGTTSNAVRIILIRGTIIVRDFR
jgi:hypothetical protein